MPVTAGQGYDNVIPYLNYIHCTSDFELDGSKDSVVTVVVSGPFLDEDGGN